MSLYSSEEYLYAPALLTKGDILIFVSKWWALKYYAFMINDDFVVHNRSNHNWNFKDDGVVIESLSTVYRNHLHRSRFVKFQKYIGDKILLENIINKALQQVGKMDYNLVFNNCQHFINYIIYGIHKSQQIQDFSLNILNGVKYA